MPRLDVPAHHMQIKAIRAQIKRDKQKNVTVRWLGLQGGKYVSLPPDWVTDNFDPIVLDEAQRRAQNEEDGLTGHLPERFLVIPPGDSRDDDPPFGLRHNRGLNYYYQGTVDNCVMGGLVNAVYWWLGQDLADELLKSKHTLGVKDFWMLFVRHVNDTLREYNLKRFTCIDILRADDATPMVVQLRSKDKSESHAICIFQGCVYDSASRFVLKKDVESLHWCCNTYGFECHLRVYRLEKKEVVPAKLGNQKKKRSRHPSSASSIMSL